MIFSSNKGINSINKVNKLLLKVKKHWLKNCQFKDRILMNKQNYYKKMQQKQYTNIAINGEKMNAA